MKYSFIIFLKLYFSKKDIRYSVRYLLLCDEKYTLFLFLYRRGNKNGRRTVAAHLCWQAVKPAVPDINWVIH